MGHALVDAVYDDNSSVIVKRSNWSTAVRRIDCQRERDLRQINLCDKLYNNGNIITGMVINRKLRLCRCFITVFFYAGKCLRNNLITDRIRATLREQGKSKRTRKEIIHKSMIKQGFLSRTKVCSKSIENRLLAIYQAILRRHFCAKRFDKSSTNVIETLKSWLSVAAIVQLNV